MPNLTDITNSINKEKDKDLIDNYNQADYPPWVVNRIYSLFPDTVFVANTINQFSFLEKRIAYKYYLYSVRAGKRFAPWLKHEISEDIQLIKEAFGVSTVKAKEMRNVLSDGDIDELRRYLDEGGITKND